MKSMSGPRRDSKGSTIAGEENSSSRAGSREARSEIRTTLPEDEPRMERILPKEIVDDLTKPGKAFLGYGVPNPKVNDMPEEPPSAAREIPTPSCYPAHLPGAQLGNRPSTRLPQGPGTSLSESPMGLFESLSLKDPEKQVVRHDLDLDHAERGCQRQRS
jgi:hypothetical protein